MKILEPRNALLSDYEVLDFLDNQRKTDIQNHRTICLEISAYLRDRPAGNPTNPQSETNISQFMHSIKQQDFNLEKAEILQLINAAPTSMPVLYNIVEECEQRFSQEQLDLLLELCSQLGNEPLHS